MLSHAQRGGCKSQPQWVGGPMCAPARRGRRECRFIELAPRKLCFGNFFYVSDINSGTRDKWAALMYINQGLMPNGFFLYEFCTNGALIRIKFSFVTNHPRAYIRRPPHERNLHSTHTNPRALARISLLCFLVFGFPSCSGRSVLRFW